MGYFPFFVELKDTPGLIVGAGRVGLHKIKKLIDYGPQLTVVAKEFDSRVKEIQGIVCEQREFTDSDIEGKSFVIAATQDEQLNAHIYKLCSERHIPVNVVDDKDKCSFIFPSVIRKENLNIGISSGGASPAMTMLLADRITDIIPDNIEGILDYLEEIRPKAKELIEDDARRSRFLAYMAGLTLKENRVPDEEETKHCLEKYYK